MARWQLIGFIHGVMNTDNVSIAGETIDYGPCAFMDTYDPEAVYSSIDVHGRYAYCNQPGIAHWNLARLAQSLLPLLAETREAAIERAGEVIERFPDFFRLAYLDISRCKLGLDEAHEEDFELISDLLACMADNQADFTLTFRRLCEVARSDTESEHALRELFREPAALDVWLARWRTRLAREKGSDRERRQSMQRANPVYIPRNHKVEEALQVAATSSDFAPFEELLRVLGRPYEPDQGADGFATPAPQDFGPYVTYCGT